MQPTTRTRPASRHARLVVCSLFALGLASCLLLLLGGGAQALTTTAATPAHAGTTANLEANAATLERASAAPAPAAGCWGAQPGASFHYRFDDRLGYTLLNQDAGLHQAAGMRLEGTLTTVVIARQQGEILTRTTFDAMAITSPDGKSLDGDPLQQRFADAARTPVLARMTEEGNVQGYQFAASLDGEQRNFLRGLLAPFAFTVPVSLPQRWDAVEADTTGNYEARYERLPQATGGQVSVRRSKVRYTVMAGGEGTQQHELRGSALASFAPRLGWLCAATVDEGMITDLPMPGMRVDYGCRAELALLDATTAAVPVDVAALWTGTWAPATGLAETLPDHAIEVERRRWQQQLQGVELDQVLAELARVFAAEKVDNAALNTAFMQLQWLTRLQPGTAAAIAAQVVAGQLTGDAAAAALSALAAAGTDQAQRVLAAIRADSTLPAAVHDAATVCLIQLSKPATDLVAGLAAEARNGQNAMLVLGALAPRCDAVLGDGRTAMDSLLALEGAANERGDLPNWLRALGNAGTPASMVAASRYLDAEDAAVREAACAALRKVADPAAVSALAERCANDASPAVRRQA
ncbi:MAG TPA: HEAT repeat domain-containing protein, partial [Planctomycetota bacterium]|nr:HEAT repeat domain-containing protein [Planctomycetota bacterium]